MSENIRTLEPVEELAKKNGKAKFVLAGGDGNAWSIMGRVANGLEKAKWSRDDIETILEEMQADDYNHLLRVAWSVRRGT